MAYPGQGGYGGYPPNVWPGARQTSPTDRVPRAKYMVVLVEQMPQAPGSGFGDIGFNIPAPDIGFNMPMPGGYPPQVGSPAMRVGAHTAHPKPCNDPRSISPRTHSLATRRSRDTRRSRCVLSPDPHVSAPRLS